MAKKTATKSRVRPAPIRTTRKTPTRGLDVPTPPAAEPGKLPDAAVAELDNGAKETASPGPQWQVINVPAPPGIYAGVDYDGNGLIFRRVDTHFGIGSVVTHLESLTGERIPASSIAQFTGPLPEFGPNPEFGMFVKLAIPVTQKG